MIDRLLSTLLAVLLAGCGANDDAERAVEPVMAPVRTQVVAIASFPEIVDATGVVAALPEGTHVVAPAYGGTIARLLVVVGARVAAGQPLCDVALDPVGVGEVDRLRRTVALAERALERQRRAFAAGVTARVALEQAEADVANARAELAGRSRDYDAATRRLTVRTPMAGVVTALDVRAGQHVDAATPLAVVVDPAALAADVRVDGAALTRIAAGQSASVRAAASSAAPIATTVARVAPALDVATQRGDVWLALPANALPPGTFVAARIEVATATHPAVPRSAVVESDEGPRVFTVRDGVAVVHAVSTGAIAGDLIAIRSGLDAGEAVVIEGAHELADGMAVAVHDGAAAR